MLIYWGGGFAVGELCIVLLWFLMGGRRLMFPPCVHDIPESVNSLRILRKSNFDTPLYLFSRISLYLLYMGHFLVKLVCSFSSHLAQGPA